MNNLFYTCLLLAAVQFFGSIEAPSYSSQKENQILKDSIPFVCGQSDGYDDFLKQNPDVLERQNRWEFEQKARVESRRLTARRGMAYEIPVVVHIIHDNGVENISDAEVAQGLRYLNEGMAAAGSYAGVGGTDTELTFRLAERDPDNNPTTGINRVVSGLTEMLQSQDLEVKDLIRWDPTCYVNFWLVREICKPGGDCGVAGYAYFPSSHGRDEDGIVMEARHFAGSPESAVVQIHEVGHYLGLYHTFEGGCKNDDCLSDGDRVCDTPPDQSTARVSCADGANSCSTDVNPSDPNNLFTTDQNDQMENFMDYASCSVLFTEGQKTRMVDALENVRFSLIDTDRCPVFCSNPVTANFSASSTEVFAGETVTFTDLSVGAVNSTWTIDGMPFSGTRYTFNDVGSFTVELRIIGADPACRDKFSLTIRVKCQVEANFSTSATQVVLNETVNFSNLSTGAASYEWTVDNSVESNALDFDISWPAPGIYTVCLAAENSFCQRKKCRRILVTDGGGEPCVGSDCEDCTNEIDDDGDGLIDFYDPDCPCVTDISCGTPFFSDCTVDCTTNNPFSGNFNRETTNADVFWKSLLIAADIDGDCKTDICLTETETVFAVLEGATQRKKYQISGNELGFFTTGDVDKDGMSEVFIMTQDKVSRDYYIERIDFNPSAGNLELTWRTDLPIGMEIFDFGAHLNHFVPMLADFNYDGRAEVYVGNQIFDAITGKQLAFGGRGMNSGETEGHPFGFTNNSRTSAVAVDMLSDSDCLTCDGLELIAGNQVLSVDIRSITDPSLNSVSVVRELAGFTDGITAVADFDLDGDLDIIINDYAEGSPNTRLTRLYIWDGQTETLIGMPISYPPGSGHGIIALPTIGDPDGDGRPEIIANSGVIRVFEDYETGGRETWGTTSATIRAEEAQSTDHGIPAILFDFNLDGKTEIISRNRAGLKVYDENLNILFQDDFFASSSKELPLVADIDDDNEAELVTFGCPSSENCKLRIYESVGIPWANTRRVWNQYSYFNVNINDDGSIPKVQQLQHLPGSTQLNSFNQQYAIPNPSECQPEDCLNGIDDDGDGLIDFFDDDCPCITDPSCGAPFYNPCHQDCKQPDPIDTMLLDVNYTGITTDRRAYWTIADIDGDCEPDICSNVSFTYFGVLGKNGLKYSLREPASYLGTVTADVDNDGAAEIFVLAKTSPTEMYIRRIDYNPLLNTIEKTWDSSQPFDSEGIYTIEHSIVPSIADFNFDGIPEVYVGNQIFDSQTGLFLGSPGAGFNTGGMEDIGGNKVGLHTTSIAIDLLPDNACADCQGLELVAGNQVFSVALNSATNPTLNEIKVVKELPGFDDGATAIADFDLDGDIDIVVANIKERTKGQLYIWDAQTPTQIGNTIEFESLDIQGVSTPAIGDLDGDARSEIVVKSHRYTISFEDYQTGGGINWGLDSARTTLGITMAALDHPIGMTLFDFNLDGKQEVVVRDQWGLFIFDAEMNVLGRDENIHAVTGYLEEPLIIDWDDDGEAEIITYGCNDNGVLFPNDCPGELIVVNSGSFRWSNTRKIQNQFAYFNTNINDNGTIPVQQQSPHLLNDPALNSFNQQYAIPNSEDCANEICDNGIDDDDDGLVDYYDPDCSCPEANNCLKPYYETCSDDCLNSAPASGISIAKNYTNIETYYLSLLAAADIDGDCQTDIVSLQNEEGNKLIIIDPVSEIVKYEIEEFPMGNFTTGDVDGDGMSEIFIIKSDQQTPDNWYLGRYEFDPLVGNLISTWISNTAIVFLPTDALNLRRHINPFLADFNGDGRPEINIGNQIFDSETGVELISGSTIFNRGATFGTGTPQVILSSAIAADLLPDDACSNCTGLELVAGNQVFAVNINSYSNPSLNSIDVAVELPGFKDGVTSIADFDTDGDLDVVVFDYPSTDDREKRVYVWDAQTPNLIGSPLLLPPNIGPVSGAVPSIGDLDGDGQPEIIVNNRQVYILNDYDDGGGINWGADASATIFKSVNSGDHGMGITLFDFNLDGKQELIFRNYSGLKILNGNLDTLASDLPLQSATINEYVIIADIDDDNEAELISHGCNNRVVPGCTRLAIYESAAEPWADTRKVWNQNSFFNTNINEDGTIPVQQQQQQLVTPVLNSFGQQYAIPDVKNDCDCVDANASAEIEDLRCTTNGIEVDFEICNDGEESLLAKTPVAIYDGNPTRINALLLLTFELDEELFPEECIFLTDTVSAIQDSVFVVVNDDGTLPRPFILENQFPITNIRECDYSDNISGFRIPEGNPPLLDLGPDILICDNGVFPLDAGAGFETYHWSDESFERTLTVYEPGKYWVEVTDLCGNIQTDTMLIEIDPITEVKLGSDLTVCEGDTIQFDAGVFDKYKWLPKSAVDCDTCQIFNLKTSQDTQVIVQVESDLGCISLDTVDIFVNDLPVGFDSVFICRGDTISVNGTAVFSDTLLSQKINSLNGCDSILNTKIIVNDSIFINEKIEICAGDTVFIFGNPITESDTLLQVFNRMNGCDSTRRVEVIAKQQLFSDDEIQVCEGDTILVFGSSITESDTLSQVYTSSVGCDSTSEIRVIFTNSINTKEELDLCAGDTVMVFGNEITKDSILYETFNSVIGCDSTHEVRVKFRPAVSGRELLEYCEGDTVMIFGNQVTESDTITQILTAANGCDSTAVVEIIYNQKIKTSGEMQFCQGDTAVIFGSRITENDTLSQIFTSRFGCDSTSEIRVVFTNSISTIEELDLCNGDTVMIFGNEIIKDSILFETFSSASGCDSTHEVSVKFRPVASGREVLEYCQGDTVMIFGNPITESDTLTQILTAANGCDSAAVVEIVFNQTAETFEQWDYCIGDTVLLFGNVLTRDDTVSQILTGTNGCDSLHYIEITFWEEAEKMVSDSLCSGDFLLFFNDTISQAGTYFHTVPASLVLGGCDTNYILTVEFFEEPTFGLVSDTLIIPGERFEIPLKLSDSTLQVNWKPNPNLSCESCQNPTVLLTESDNFEAEITNVQGCSVIAQISINVADEEGVYIPSAFSPNGDSNNDFFTVFSTKTIQIEQLQIFDRWGGLLFELNDFDSNDPQVGWDGTSNGDPVNTGVYVYKFLLINDDGEQEMAVGDITIVR